MALNYVRLSLKFTEWSMLQKGYISFLLFFKSIELGQQRLLTSEALLYQIYVLVFFNFYLIARNRAIFLPRRKVIKNLVHFIE